MTVIGKLASSLGRKDEVPNQELAKQIASKKDKKAIQELIANLTNKNKDIQNDCIKVLYEIGAINPSLIAGYTNDFIALLDSRNNRLQWGAMTAINSVALENPDTVFKALGKLAVITDKGSVITRDNYVAILTKLYSIPIYSDAAFNLLHEQLANCPSNQVPMYAENILPFITAKHTAAFVAVLRSRLNDFEKESKQKRVEKVLKKMKA